MTRDELEKRNVGENLDALKIALRLLTLILAATVSAAFCTRAAAPIPVNL